MLANPSHALISVSHLWLEFQRHQEEEKKRETTRKNKQSDGQDEMWNGQNVG